MYGMVVHGLLAYNGMNVVCLPLFVVILDLTLSLTGNGKHTPYSKPNANASRIIENCQPVPFTLSQPTSTECKHVLSTLARQWPASDIQWSTGLQGLFTLCIK